MPKLETQGISLHYETFGDRRKPPLMLIAGLGGVGAGWGPQIERFAAEHFVVLPDHRGTGADHAGGRRLHHRAARGGHGRADRASRRRAGPYRRFVDRRRHCATDGARPRARRCAASRWHPRSRARMASCGANSRCAASWPPKATCRRPTAAPRCFCFRRAMRAKIRSAWPPGSTAPPRCRRERGDRAQAHRHDHGARRFRAARRDPAAGPRRLRQRRLLHAAAHVGRNRRRHPRAELKVLPGAGHFVYIEQEQRFFDTVRAFVGRH